MQTERSQQGHESLIGPEFVKTRFYAYEDDARRLMELGFLPGHAITPGHSAPGGDPRVFRVDGSEVALRRETAKKLILRQTSDTPASRAAAKVS